MIHFEFAYFSLFSVSFLLIWNWNNKYIRTLQWFPWKPYRFSDQNGLKTLPFGAAQTYMACIGEYP